jgi:hypothetical protein
MEAQRGLVDFVRVEAGGPDAGKERVFLDLGRRLLDDAHRRALACTLLIGLLEGGQVLDRVEAVGAA